MNNNILVCTLDPEILPYTYNQKERVWEESTEPYSGKMWLSNQTGLNAWADRYIQMRAADWAPFLLGLAEVQLRLGDKVVSKHGVRSLTKVSPGRWESLRAPRPLEPTQEHELYPVQLEYAGVLYGLDVDDRGRGGWYRLSKDTVANPNKHYGPWGTTIRLADEIITTKLSPPMMMRIVTATYDNIAIYRDDDEVMKWAFMWAVPRIKEYWRKRKSEKLG